MKKLVTMMLGLSLMFGTVSVMFGQDTTTMKKKSGKKGKKAPKTNTTTS